MTSALFSNQYIKAVCKILIFLLFLALSLSINYDWLIKTQPSTKHWTLLIVPCLLFNFISLKFLEIFDNEFVEKKIWRPLDSKSLLTYSIAILGLTFGAYVFIVVIASKILKLLWKFMRYTYTKLI